MADDTTKFQFLPVRLSKSDHFRLPIVDCLFDLPINESIGNQQSKIGNASVPSGATKQIDLNSYNPRKEEALKVSIPSGATKQIDLRWGSKTVVTGTTTFQFLPVRLSKSIR